MDGQRLAFLVEQVLESVKHQFEDRGVRIGIPAGITFAVFGLGSDSLEAGSHPLGRPQFGAFHRGPLAGGNQHVPVLALDGCQVSGGLHEIGDFIAHPQNAVRAGHQGVNQFVPVLFPEDPFRFSGFFGNEFQIGFGMLVFGSESIPERGDVLFHFRKFVLGDADQGCRFPGNRVAQVSALERGEPEIVLVFQIVECAGQELVGVGAAFVDVVAGVAAAKAFYLDIQVG